MARRLKVVAGIGVGVGPAAWLGALGWDRRTALLKKSLGQPASTPQPETVTFDDFARLPFPVARYFRRVLTEGQPVVRSACLTWEGKMRVREANEGWKPFTATQFFSTKPAGFVWDARFRMAPLVPVRVRDAYVAGQGSAQVNLFSFVTLANENNKAELDAGALHRYLAEAVWLPTTVQAVCRSCGQEYASLLHVEDLQTVLDQLGLDQRMADGTHYTVRTTRKSAPPAAAAILP